MITRKATDLPVSTRQHMQVSKMNKNAIKGNAVAQAAESIITVVTGGHTLLFFTGRTGPSWVGETEAEAMVFSDSQEARTVADNFSKKFLCIGIAFQVIEKRQHHAGRTCLVRGSNGVDYFLMPDEASIIVTPAEWGRLAGFREQAYGDVDHLRNQVVSGAFPDLDGFTDAGLELLSGLSCKVSAPLSSSVGSFGVSPS